MKKEEVADLMIRLFNCLDQAGYDYAIEKLMRAAPVPAQKEFIETIISNNKYDIEPETADIVAAKKLLRFED